MIRLIRPILPLLLLCITLSLSAHSQDPGQPSAKSAKPTKPANTIRIVSWNLDWFPGKKPEPTATEEKDHVAQAQQVLKELNPDVLLLQEVRDWNSAVKLCSALPNLRVEVISRFQPRLQNQVIATNLPVETAWSDEWKHVNGDPPRGYVFAAIKLPENRFLLTYSLHLKRNVGAPAMNPIKMRESIRQLLDHAQTMKADYGARGKVAFLVGGDLNTSLDDPQFAKEQTLQSLIASGFHWSFDNVPFAQRITIPAKGGYADNCFDHIFTDGLGKQTAFVKPYPKASDHNPVVIDIDLAKADFQSSLDVKEGFALLKKASASASSSSEPESDEEIEVTKTLNATDHDAIRASVGKVVAIRGKVHDVGKTKTSSVNFINFNGIQRGQGQFVGIVKGEDLAAVTESLGGELKAMLTGKIVELRGEIILYKNTPKILVTSGRHIKIVKGLAPPPPPPPLTGHAAFIFQLWTSGLEPDPAPTARVAPTASLAPEAPVVPFSGSRSSKVFTIQQGLPLINLLSGE